jgi:hypothetical protein
MNENFEEKNMEQIIFVKKEDINETKFIVNPAKKIIFVLEQEEDDISY